MGRVRKSKYDWEALLKEYLESEYTNKTAFAKAKGINPSFFRRNTTDWPEKDKKTKQSKKKSNVTLKGKSNVTENKQVKTPKPHEPNICAAKTRQGTMCKNPAGFRTPHFGAGRCYLHGGLSTGGRGKGGPHGNKKGLKTGLHEAIWLDVLPEEEQDLYHEIITDKVAQLDQEIRLIEIRERRMLQRIERLKQHDFTVVEVIEELTEDSTKKEEGANSIKTKKLATLGQIQAIEEALTKVQARKERLLDLKHKFEQSQGPSKPDMSAYVEALRGTAKEAWQKETSKPGERQ